MTFSTALRAIQREVWRMSQSSVRRKRKPLRALSAGLGALSLLGVATAASAVTFPYTCGGAPGAPRTPCGYWATSYKFTAASTGQVDAYFADASAWYTDTVGMLVNGVSTGVFGLNNQTSHALDELDLGNVTKGDTIVLQLHIIQTGNPALPPSPNAVYATGDVYSDPSMNTTYDTGSAPGDGHNHIYLTPFLPGLLSNTYFIGWEDQSFPTSDYDYNDEQIVVTNLDVTTVPEPAAWALMLVGFGGLARRPSPARPSRECSGLKR